MYIHVYIYIYIERERVIYIYIYRERERYIDLSLSIYIYIIRYADMAFGVSEQMNKGVKRRTECLGSVWYFGQGQRWSE